MPPFHLGLRQPSLCLEPHGCSLKELSAFACGHFVPSGLVRKRHQANLHLSLLASFAWKLGCQFMQIGPKAGEGLLLREEGAVWTGNPRLCMCGKDPYSVWMAQACSFLSSKSDFMDHLNILSKPFFSCLRPMGKIIRHKEVVPGKTTSWSLQVTQGGRPKDGPHWRG